MKLRLSRPPILAFPDIEKPFEASVNAFGYAFETALTQKQNDGRIHPVQFASSSLSEEDKRYGTFEQEEGAVIFCLKRFPHYFLSGSFVVYNDQRAYRAAFGKTDLYGSLLRSLNLMAKYNFKIRRLSGDRIFIAHYHPRCIGDPQDDGEVDDPRIGIFLADCAKMKKYLLGSSHDASRAAYKGEKYEKALREVKSYLTTFIGTKARTESQQQLRSFEVTQVTLSKRAKNGSSVVPALADQNNVLRSMHNEIGHCPLDTKKNFIKSHFCWPTIQHDANFCV